MHLFTKPVLIFLLITGAYACGPAIIQEEGVQSSVTPSPEPSEGPSTEPSYEPTPEPPPSPTPEPMPIPEPELWVQCPSELNVGLMRDSAFHKMGQSFFVLTAYGGRYGEEMYDDNQLYVIDLDKGIDYLKNAQGMCLNPDLKIQAIEQGIENQLWLLIRWPFKNSKDYDYRVVILNTDTFDIQVFADLGIPPEVPGSFTEFDGTYISDFVLDANNSVIYYSLGYSDVNSYCDYIEEDAEGNREFLHTSQDCKYSAFEIDASNLDFYTSNTEKVTPPYHLEQNRSSISRFILSEGDFSIPPELLSLIITDTLLIKSNILISTGSDNRIVRSDFLARKLITLAGNGSIGDKDGQGENAEFNYPTSIIRDNAENFFVTDALNFALRKITPEGDVSTIYRIPIDKRQKALK